MLVLLVELLLDPVELGLDGVLLLLDLFDLLVQLVLALLALLQLELNVSRTLGLPQFALEQHNLTIEALLLVLGDVSSQQSVLQSLQFLREVLAAA